MPDFHVFYCNQQSGAEVPADRPRPIALERIPGLAVRILAANGDFIGLVDDDDGVLQFIYLARSEGDDRPIRMELAEPDPDGVERRHLSNAEMIDLLQNLPERLTIERLARAALLRQSP